MKQYKVNVSPNAREDLKHYLSYIKNKLKNPQAAKSVAEDFRQTKIALSRVAASLAEPESELLAKRKLKRFNFKKHDYFVLFLIDEESNSVEIANIFHMSEDYESKLR